MSLSVRKGQLQSARERTDSDDAWASAIPMPDGNKTLHTVHLSLIAEPGSPSGMATEIEPYEIRCAEVWGGVNAKQDQITTAGVRAVIHSSASGDERGGDVYYFSVCAYDALTRIAIADVRGHGLAASQISNWLYDSLESRMNDSNGAGVLQDLNDIVRRRGFEAITTAAVATFHREKGELYYCYAGHPPLMMGGSGEAWRELPAPAAQGPANLPLGIMGCALYPRNSPGRAR